MNDVVAERLAELAGPLVVKEVRQGLRGRVFAIFFGVLLTACFFVALFAWGQASPTGSARYGRDTLALLLGAQGVVCFFIIPFTAFRSMAKELEDETWVLLTLTGLGSRSITRGKWVSAMSQAGLYASACAPFVLFSYFLNGVDLQQLVVALVLSAGWSALLSAVAVAIAAQAHSRLARTVALFVALGVLLVGTGAGLAFCTVLAQEGQRMLSRDESRFAMLGIFIFSVGLTWLALELAGAGLAAPSEHASRWPRRALVTVTVSALLFGAGVFLETRGNRQDAAVGQILTCLFLALAGVGAVAERDGWPRELRAARGVRPGALRSFGLMLGLLGLSTATWLALLLSVDAGADKYLRSIVFTPLYPALYWSLGVLVNRLTVLRRAEQPMAAMASFLMCVALGTGLSVLAALLIDGRADHRVLNALNPFVGVVNFIDRSSSDMNVTAVILGGATVLVTLLALGVLRSRDEVRT